MKKTILSFALVSLFVLPLSTWAEETQSPQPLADKMQMTQMPPMLQKIQEMRNKVTGEKDPATRKDLMRQHLQTMQ